MYSNYNEEDVNNANEEIVAQGLQKLGHAASDKVKRGNSSKTPLFCKPSNTKLASKLQHATNEDYERRNN